MSLHKVVTESAHKMKDGLHHIEIEKSDDGKGFIATHHMHDYEHPKQGHKHILTSHAQLSKHMKEHMPLEEPDDEGD